MGAIKETVLSGSPYHLAKETAQATWTAVGEGQAKQVPAMLTDVAHNVMSPAAYDAFRTSGKWSPVFDDMAAKGVTGITTREGEAVDKLLGPRGYVARGAIGAAGGGAEGYTTGQASGQTVGVGPLQLDTGKLTQALIHGAAGAGVAELGMAIGPALWERGIPTFKAYGNEILRAAGYSDPEIMSRLNNTFGGQNLTRMARSPEVQAALRSTVFAPDWWESWGRNLGAVLKAGGEGDAARKYVGTTVIASVLGTEALNLLVSGGQHGILSNDRAHPLGVNITPLVGTDPKGSDQYIDFSGPVGEIAGALLRPAEYVADKAGLTGQKPHDTDLMAPVRFLEGRASQPLQAAAEAMTGKTPSVYEVSAPDASLQQRAIDVAMQVIKGANPAGASSTERTSNSAGIGAAIAGYALGGKVSAGQSPAERVKQAVQDNTSYTRTGSPPQQTLNPSYDPTQGTRGLRDVPRDTANAMLADAGIPPDQRSQYRIDHITPLELGGSNHPDNLQIQPRDEAAQKDIVETYLHDQVRYGGLSLAEAQQRIYQDWRGEYSRIPERQRQSIRDRLQTAGASSPAPSGSKKATPADLSVYGIPTTTPSRGYSAPAASR